MISRPSLLPPSTKLRILDEHHDDQVVPDADETELMRQCCWLTLHELLRRWPERQHSNLLCAILTELIDSNDAPLSVVLAIASAEARWSRLLAELGKAARHD